MSLGWAFEAPSLSFSLPDDQDEALSYCSGYMCVAMLSAMTVID